MIIIKQLKKMIIIKQLKHLLLSIKVILTLKTTRITIIQKGILVVIQSDHGNLEVTPKEGHIIILILKGGRIVIWDILIVIQKGGRVVIQDICIAIQNICLVVLDICIVILDIRIVIQEDLMDITIKDHIVIQGEVIVVVGEKKNIQSVKIWADQEKANLDIRGMKIKYEVRVSRRVRED